MDPHTETPTSSLGAMNEQNMGPSRTTNSRAMISSASSSEKVSMPISASSSIHERSEGAVARVSTSHENQSASASTSTEHALINTTSSPSMASSGATAAQISTIVHQGRTCDLIDLTSEASDDIVTEHSLDFHFTDLTSEASDSDPGHRAEPCASTSYALPGQETAVMPDVYLRMSQAQASTHQSFELFPRFPAELRCRVWKFSMVPRIVRWRPGGGKTIGAMHANQESRAEYEKHYRWFPGRESQTKRDKPVPGGFYLCLNFDLDYLHISYLARHYPGDTLSQMNFFVTISDRDFQDTMVNPHTLLRDWEAECSLPIRAKVQKILLDGQFYKEYPFCQDRRLDGVLAHCHRFYKASGLAGNLKEFSLLLKDDAQIQFDDLENTRSTQLGQPFKSLDIHNMMNWIRKEKLPTLVNDKDYVTWVQSLKINFLAEKAST